MGKPKRGPLPKKKVSALGSDDEDLYKDLDDANPKSRKYFYSEIDEFNNDREKIMLDNDDDELPSRNYTEEVLPLPDDSDEDSENDDLYGNGFYQRMVQKDELASDIEDNEHDDLPNDKAWGKKKSLYYNTDYVDKDYDGYQGSDVEMAEAEEKEATRIQKRLLQELSEEDFGLEWITPETKTGVSAANLDKEKVATDLSSLSQDEKLELLRKESPELMCVINDFELRMTELKDKIMPLIPLVEDGRIPPGLAADYLTAKRKLIYLYCTNISFYMMIRCSDVNVKHHPVMKCLLTYRKLLKQLDPISEKLDNGIETVLKLLKTGEEIEPVSNTLCLEKPTKSKNNNKSKKIVEIRENGVVSLVQEKLLKSNQKVTVEKRKKGRSETADEKAALEMYELMKEKNRKKVNREEINSEEEDSEEEVQESEMKDDSRDEDVELGESKREITYQIAKNKGLTPHRKKEYRNPRVRHRVKFQKAKVRRKGQYKQPRTELQRYSGEISGIRIGTKRGIKLK